MISIKVDDIFEDYLCLRSRLAREREDRLEPERIRVKVSKIESSLTNRTNRNKQEDYLVERIHKLTQSHVRIERLVKELEPINKALKVVKNHDEQIFKMLTMKHINKWSYRQIADSLGLGVEKVRNDIHKGNRKFKKLYEFYSKGGR